MELKYSERLSRLVLIILSVAIAGAVLWYLRGILLYLVLAAVVTLIAHPLFAILKKIHIGKFHLPDWLASILSMCSILAVIIGVITFTAPLIYSVVNEIASIDSQSLAQAISAPLAQANEWAVSTFPGLGSDFRIEDIVLEHLNGLLSVGAVTSVVSSVTTIVAKTGIALFATIFISFFAIKHYSKVSPTIASFFPDEYSEKIRASLSEIGKLISRYFVGIFCEILAVSTINFLGLLLVAQMGFKYSIGIAFIAGILNIVPYVGPICGTILGVVISLAVKYDSVGACGLAVEPVTFIMIVAGIFIFTQLLDAYFMQPTIYSNSVKAHPLEIFLVILIASYIGGVLGMLCAIPSYTVVRVIARQFFRYTFGSGKESEVR